jgi:hypothetical protein
MTKKEITKFPDIVSADISYNEGENITLCSFCNRHPCECKFLICPFHGKVNAKEESDGTFNCAVKFCDITRNEKELES